MIYTLHIDNANATPVPHWNTVPWLKDIEKIDFKPGLNILYGSNGTGKSTVITGLAKAFHCHQTNWPIVTRQSVSEFLRSSGLVANGFTVEHDGEPVRYLGHSNMAGIPETVEQVDLMLAAKGDHVNRTSAQMSAGQNVILQLIRFLKNDAKKVSYKLKSSQVSASFQPVWLAAVEQLKNPMPREGIPRQQTLLLDEVDLNLDFAHQATVWAQLRELAKTHQLIVASHSPFAVNVPGAHYIETTPGYLDASRKALKLLLNDISTTTAPRRRVSAA